MHRLLQLTLDLFDVPAPAPMPVLKQKVPAVSVPRAEDAIKSVASAPAESLEQVIAQASFRHPRANREAMLDGCHIAFELRRARRRNIGFLVGAEGLAVTAPKWVPLYEIDAAVQSKSAWILRKLH
ncbi:MAG: metal-dependent hydrolase, partial [Haliea sp.]